MKKPLITFLCSFPFFYNLAVLADTPNNNAIEVIEVTAQKRVQSVQTIPMSINALSEETLVKAHIQQATEITTLIPNVNATRSISGVSNYFIRGVGMDGFNLSSVTAVGLYLDDVAISNPMLTNFALFDIARVEVLKGPQNTLFGKNTTGGAINFISHNANDELNGYSTLTLGNNNKKDITGAINLSLSNKLNIRLAAFSHKRDGTVSSKLPTNDTKFNDINQFGARLKLAYQFSENLTVSANLYGGKQDQIAEIKTAMSPTNGESIININDQHLSTNHSAIINPPNDINALGGFLKLTALHKHFTFNAITSFEQVDSQRMDDWGGQHLPSSVYQALTYNSTDTEAISQEFQFQSTKKSNVHWILGALYHLEQGDIFQAALIDPAGAGRPDDAIPDAGIGPMFDRGAWIEKKAKTLSIYGQFTYALTPTLNLTSGYRWTQQSLTPTVNAAGMMMDLPGQEFPLGSLGWYSLGNNDLNRLSDFVGFERAERFLVANGGFPASEKIDEKFNEWGGKIALDYKMQPNLMLYASLSRGFKMGAVNSNPTSTAFKNLLSKVAQPETLITTEFGFKSDLLNKTLRVNGAVFKNIWQDYQFYLVYNPGNPAHLFASLVNLPEAESVGAELEAIWNASSSLRFNVAIAWLNTEVTNGELNTTGISDNILEGFQNQASRGNELTNAPEWSANIAAFKHIEFSESELEFSINYNYLGKHVHQLAGEHSKTWIENFSERSIGLVTLNALYLFGENREYQLSLWAKNATDEQYCSERAIAPGTSPETSRLCVQGDARSFGLTGKITF